MTANALGSLTWMCCSFVGSFLGGVVTSYVGEFANFILDSMTFLVSSIFIAQLFRYKNLQPDEIKKTLKRMNAEEMMHVQSSSSLEKVEDKAEEAANVELIETNDTEEKVESVDVIDESTDKDELADKYEPTQIEESEVMAKRSLLSLFIAQIKEFFIGFRFLFKHPYSKIIISNLASVIYICSSFSDFCESNWISALGIDGLCLLKNELRDFPTRGTNS